MADRPFPKVLLLVPLVAFPLLVGGVGIGAMQLAPESFEGGAERRVPLPAEKVWAKIGDPVNHPLSTRQEPIVTRLPDVNGLPSWREDLGASVVTVVTTELTASYVVRTLQDSVVPVQATWRIEVTPDGDQTLVKVRQTGTIVGGGAAGGVVRAVMWFGGADSGPKQYVRALDRASW